MGEKEYAAVELRFGSIMEIIDMTLIDQGETFWLLLNDWDPMLGFCQRSGKVCNYCCDGCI